MNPQVSFVTVTSTPAVLFAGCGKIEVSLVAPFNTSVFLGDATLGAGGSGGLWKLVSSSLPFSSEFNADASLVAATPAGFSQQVKIVRWF